MREGRRNTIIIYSITGATVIGFYVWFRIYFQSQSDKIDSLTGKVSIKHPQDSIGYLFDSVDVLMDSGKTLFIMLLLFIIILKVLGRIRQRVAAQNTAEVAAIKASEQNAAQLQTAVAQLQNQQKDSLEDITQSKSTVQEAEKTEKLSEKGNMYLF